eukprot:s2016_g9.t1
MPEREGVLKEALARGRFEYLIGSQTFRTFNINQGGYHKRSTSISFARQLQSPKRGTGRGPVTDRYGCVTTPSRSTPKVRDVVSVNSAKMFGQ